MSAYGDMSESMTLSRWRTLFHKDAHYLGVVRQQWLQTASLRAVRANVALKRVHHVFQSIVDVVHVESWSLEVQPNL
jgi:hypothetical protein